MATKRKAQIDFARYGRFLLLAAFLVGLFLSRHAASAWWEEMRAYSLAGETDDPTSTSLIDDKGTVHSGTRGSYHTSVDEGTGYFGYMGGAALHSIEHQSFSDPLIVMYLFWGFLGLGIALLLLNRVVGTRWRSDVKKRSREREVARKTVAPRLENVPLEELPPGERARRTGQFKASSRESLDIDVDIDIDVNVIDAVLEHTSHTTDERESLARSADNSVGGFAMRGDGAIGASSTSVPARSGSDLYSNVDNETLKRSGTFKSRGRATGAHPSLKALGLATVDEVAGERGWLSDSSMGTEAPLSSSSSMAQESSQDVFSYGAVQLDSGSVAPFMNPDNLGSASALPARPAPSKPFVPPLSISAPSPSAPAPAPDPAPAPAPAQSPPRFGEERMEKRSFGQMLDDLNDFDVAAEHDWEEESMDIDIHELLGPDATLSPNRPKLEDLVPQHVLERGRRSSMERSGFAASGLGGSGFGASGLEAQDKRGATLPPPNLYRSQLPGLQTNGSLRVFVAPLTEGELGTGGGNSDTDPVFGLDAAIARTRSHAAHGDRVELRLMPGVYREQIELGPNMLIVNDAIPLELDGDDLIAWLVNNSPASSAEHVILTLPIGASPNAFVLSLSHAHDTSVAGLHIIGRSVINRTTAASAFGRGVEIVNSERVTFRLCAMLGHQSDEDGAAFHITSSGGTSSEDAVALSDCMVYQNTTSARGGAIYCNSSALMIESCMLQDNRSATAGGAMYIEHTRCPMRIVNSRVESNLVHCGEELPPRSQTGWTGEDGHGGGVYLRHGDIQFEGCNITTNKAQGAGGGVYALAGRVLLEAGSEGAESRVMGNRALRGGGLLLCGLSSTDPHTGLAAMRAVETRFNNNTATESGGGIASFRLASIDLRRCVLNANFAKADHGEGGALHATVGSRVKLTQTHLIDNTAPFRGGAISVCNSSLRVLEGCVMEGNSATSGGCGALAFYTRQSTFVDDLARHPRLEFPFVCAVAQCSIEGNAAVKGVGGVFVGSFQKKSAYAITYTFKSPEAITNNSLAKERPGRPTNLVVMWRGAMQCNDSALPRGRKELT